MKVFYILGLLIFKILLLTILSCSKDDFLNEKPQKSLLTITSIDDLQALLDRDSDINGLNSIGLTPQLGESASDNIYVLETNFNTNLPPQMQNYYTWNSSPYSGIEVLDWTFPYRAILYTNTALDELKKFESNPSVDEEQVKFIRGQALFHRAYLYHQLAQVFSPPYDMSGDNNGRGLPLRLSADINENIQVASVKETYDQIIADIKASALFLTSDNRYRHRPSKQAAYGLLARVYLSMGDYGNAKLYADSCLEIQDDIVDYNTINLSAAYPFGGKQDSPITDEIIFSTALLSIRTSDFPLTFDHGLIDSNLYQSYADKDLRKKAFFHELPNGFRFKGTYARFSSQALYFSGLAVNEIVLIRAECLAREGNVSLSLNDLNRLMRNRWSNSEEFEEYKDLNAEDALSLILEHRRKELIYRGLRWSDLRRLNQEGYNITLVRNMNGQTYTLPAGDKRWTFPYPLEVVLE